MLLRFKQILSVFFVCFTIFTLAACSPTGNTTSGSVTPTASATTAAQLTPTLPAGTVLYQADWSHGLAGWHSTAGWTVIEGQLLTDGSANSSITASYMPTVPNYAVEARIQIVRVAKPVANKLAIFATATANKDGYEAGAIGMVKQAPFRGFAQVITNAMATFQEIDYFPGAGWRTYRVEVQGNRVSFFIDGTRVSISTSTLPAISDGPIGLLCDGVVARVSSFSVTAL